MPGYKTHLLGGALIFAPLYYIATELGILQSPYSFILLFGTTLFGSLFPDLDITSKIQRFFYFGIFIAFLYFLFMHQWFSLGITAVLAVVIGILRHRTILHHPLFLTLLPIPFIYYMTNNNIPFNITIPPSLFFIAGTWSHLLLDFGFKMKRRRS